MDSIQIQIEVSQRVSAVARLMQLESDLRGEKLKLSVFYARIMEEGAEHMERTSAMRALRGKNPLGVEVKSETAG